MRPNLAQVLNTLAHEIRTPLAVSQGYVKLLLDGRLTHADDTQRAMEQTRHALGTLATYCVDMGKISALADSDRGGIPERVTAAELLSRLRGYPSLQEAAWSGDGNALSLEGRPVADLLESLAIVVASTFDEGRGKPLGVRVQCDEALTIVAGVDGALATLLEGPDGSSATGVNFGKGGKGLKLIWAAFVLDKHHAQAWALRDEKASVAIRIPWVTA